MCVDESSNFSSNFGMSNGNLTGMVDHNKLWRMGSFVKYENFNNSNVTKKGNDMLANEYWVEYEESYGPDGS
jgi:hypothetical protein